MTDPRRAFPTLILILFGLAHTDAVAQTPPAERPPNVVIIFTDDQGYSDVDCFGARGFETPHLDRMAAEGAA